MRVIPCPVSEMMLRDLYHVQKLTDEEIASQIAGDATVKRVRTWRHRFGIETLPRWSRNDVPPIEGRLRSLLVGSMLGDGRVVFQGTGSYYSESHSGAQQDYLEWKAAIWGPSWAGALTDVPDKRGFTQVRMTTVTHGTLNAWRDLFYASRERGWKRLVPQIVDMVDDFALAVWYLDDGCAGWWPGITFGADPASREVALAIFEKFGIRPMWQVKNGNTGEFHMEREDTAHRFLDIVRPHVPACMVYKLDFGFQGPHYQVRKKLSGISEMLREGMSVRRIASASGVGASTVSRHMDAHGLTTSCAPSAFERGVQNKERLYVVRYPNHQRDGSLFRTLAGERVAVRTAVLRPRSDAPHVRRWSFGLRGRGEVSTGCDVYLCLCLDAAGQDVVAEFRIPVADVGDSRVIHVSENYAGTMWAPYLVTGAGLDSGVGGSILDLFS